ncbi:uncharacterized protein V1518DRAFT_427480 [Limtongia smithiae]|uniref:uncharacterized protein n=1 Tax=Limtongia smithiae TaxID=1125753 RepID=UPI0034CD2103
MASDSAATTLIACVVLGFFLVRWLIAPSASSDTRTPSSASSSSSSSSSTSSASSPSLATPPASSMFRRRRPVTDDMVDVILAIAPQLSVAQIRHDLEQTGNVEITIERILAEGTLPMPPGVAPRPPPPQLSSSSTAQSKQYPDLIKRYKLEDRVAEDGNSTILPTTPSTPVSVASPADKVKWSQSREERQTMLRKQREDMILKARRKLEADAF